MLCPHRSLGDSSVVGDEQIQQFRVGHVGFYEVDT